jgi:hypothetical protein
MIPTPKHYAARRHAQGKSSRDIQRCLKRIIARQLFRLLERYGHPSVHVLSATCPTDQQPHPQP